MSIYNNKFKNGQMWLRTLDGTIQQTYNILSSVFIKYQNLNQSFFNEISTNNILRFDVFYDNIFIETKSGYTFEKIFFDQKTDSFIPFQYNSNFNLNTYIPIDYWFDETNLKIYIAQIAATAQTYNAFNFYVIINEYDCVMGEITELFKSNFNISLNGANGWGTTLNNDIFFANINTPKICYNTDTNRFNISFDFKNFDGEFALVSMDFSNNEQFTLESLNALMPFAASIGNYTVTNLINNTLTVPTSSNLYINLSSASCSPVSFEVLGNQTITESVPVVFSNGIVSNVDESLNNCLQFTINNKTALFLTDLTNTNNFLTDSIAPQNSGILTEIDSPVLDQYVLKTPLADNNYNVLALTGVDEFVNTLSSSYLKMFVTSVTAINSKNVFRFVIQPDNSMIVQDTNTKYLMTSLFKGNNGLIFTPQIIPTLSSATTYVDAQRFDYALGPNTISLFQIDDANLLPRFQNAVTKNSNGFYVLSSLSYLTSATIFPHEASLNFTSYQEVPPLDSDIKNSFLVSYEVSPTYNQSTLVVNTSTANSLYTQNYLGVFPYQYPIKTATGVVYPLAIHGLKNYQTPEYNYSFGFDYVQGQKGVRRKYENVYTGTNQDKGLDYVYLGYTADTLEMNFPSDQDTQFVFSPTSERVPLSSVGLIEDGAIAGEIPFTSDRIFIKLQDYSQIIPDSPQPPSITKYSNTWLCSWLSGTMTGDKVWMDRYYNAAYYTADQALSAKVIQYNDRLFPTETYTFDLPSETYLEPGVFYRYFHTGINNRKNFVQHLSGNSILTISQWLSSPLVDESPMMGEGILYFNKPNNLVGDYINLDGTNHALFPATTELLAQDQLTVSLWLNPPDWNNVAGNQIFGNYYESGFGLINQSSLTTPIITLVDSNDPLAGTKIYNLNYLFTPLPSVSATDTYLLTNGNKIVQRLPDYSYWVFDSFGVGGTKYDINNKPIIKTSDNIILNNNLTGKLSSISQVELDRNGNFYIYDINTKNYVKMSPDGNWLDSQSLSNNVNTIQIDLNDNLITCYGTQSVIDNNNNVWEIVGGNLYKNQVVFANMGIVQQISVDASNYLWVLSSQDSISKIDTVNNKILFTNRIGSKSGLAPDPCFFNYAKPRYINFIRVPRDQYSNKCDTTTISTDDRVLLVDLNDEVIYTLDQNGAILTKLNFLGLTNNSKMQMNTLGDFTGYQYLRKFASVSKSFGWQFKVATPNNQNPEGYNLLTLSYDLNNIASGWHHFSFVFDSYSGTAKAYLDSILVAEQDFTPEIYQLYYTYRTSLLLGAETIQNTTLNDFIQIDNGYKFVGKVADLRMYNKSLTQGEIEQIYLSSKYGANDRTLLWNMSVGDRNYIEQIKYWYKNQLPGSKSKYFNINIHNLNIDNGDVRAAIEAGIETNIAKIAPANTSLYKINWK